MAEANGMTVVNQHIASGEFSQIYLMGGSEQYLLAQFREKLVTALIDPTDTMNFVRYKGENAKADEIAEFASTMPFFADRRVVLVEDSDFFKKGNETMEKVLEELPETTTLIFSEDQIDKRGRLYKQVAKLGTVLNFETPDASMIERWLVGIFAKEEIQIERKALENLLEFVGLDMSNLANEAEKLVSYCYEKKTVTAEDVEKLSINQVEGKIFEMMDALSRRDSDATMKYYADLLALREPAMRLLFLITRQFRILLKTKLALETGTPYEKLASVLKVPPFTVKKYVAQCKGFSQKRLMECVGLCQEADTDIKTGRKKDTMAVEMLIVELLQHRD